jgi:hypothetical protein
MMSGMGCFFTRMAHFYQAEMMAKWLRGSYLSIRVLSDNSKEYLSFDQRVCSLFN